MRIYRADGGAGCLIRLLFLFIFFYILLFFSKLLFTTPWGWRFWSPSAPGAGSRAVAAGGRPETADTSSRATPGSPSKTGKTPLRSPRAALTAVRR